ncbi:unnamed protein product, partial [Tilletia laevis]
LLPVKRCINMAPKKRKDPEDIAPGGSGDPDFGSSAEGHGQPQGNDALDGTPELGGIDRERTRFRPKLPGPPSAANRLIRRRPRQSRASRSSLGNWYSRHDS